MATETTLGKLFIDEVRDAYHAEKLSALAECGINEAAASGDADEEDEDEEDEDEEEDEEDEEDEDGAESAKDEYRTSAMKNSGRRASSS